MSKQNYFINLIKITYIIIGSFRLVIFYGTKNVSVIICLVWNEGETFEI